MLIGYHVGEVPSTTFVTDLVNRISERHDVIVYGRRAGASSHSYRPDVMLCLTPNHRLGKAYFLIRHLVRFVIFGKARSLFLRYVFDGGRGESVRRLIFGLPFAAHCPQILHLQWAKSLSQFVELRQFCSFALVLSLRGTHISSSPLANPELAEDYRRCFPEVNGFHAVCQAIKTDAVVLGAASERIRVIYSAANTQLLEAPPPELREDIFDLRILSVGRIHWRKGYFRALDALALLHHRSFIYRILAGEPDDELIWSLHDQDLTENVEFLSNAPWPKVLEEMGNADVLLVPSVGEGIANVAIEAMAIGLPVISTRCGGMPELIVDGENGFLCDAWDSESMASVLENFRMASLEKRRAIQKNARQFVAASRKVDSLTEGICKLYEESAAHHSADH